MLALPMLLGLAACSESDKTFINPLGSDIYGLWYADYQASGTAGSDNTPYSRVVQAVKFNSDGTGTWWRAVFTADNASKPLEVEGGRYAVSGTFDYTVAADGTITAKRRGEKLMDGHPMTLTFRFANGVLTTQDGGATQTLAVAPKDYDNVLLALENSMQGADAENYNINDGEITAENWRQHDAIYIYDGKGTDVKDAQGRTGYTLVNLPWYNGDKLTNLPHGFCDDLTPEMGWEWVINRCGSRSIADNNFFAVYNKYTGILRFFYYLPQGFSTGNDHVWQVSMTDNLATRTTIPYGVPEDRTVSNKAAINQTGQGTYMEYVTPWTDYLSQDGLIVPNAGWWAFDVDLSMTRPEALSADNSIKLQMRSWNTQHASLYSTIDANIDGTMQGTFEGKTPLQVSSSKGFFGKVGDFIKIGSQVKDVIAAYKTGDFAGAIKGGIGAAKSGMSLASGKPKTTGGDPMIEGTFEGTLNLMLKGTINTDGVISGSQPTVGIASPTFSLKDFDTKNSHLGQGVWNLKKTPVVYRTNYLGKQYAELFGLYTVYHNSPDDYYWSYEAYTQFYFFDPSSIEIELNPNIFPESEIEWMQVDAISGVRKNMLFTGTDAYSEALGIEKTEMNMRYKFTWYYFIHDFLYLGDPVYDSVYNMTFPYNYDYSDSEAEQAGCVYNKDSEKDFSITWLAGRGADNYIIEPAYVITKNNLDAGIKGKVFKTPAFEISVTLTVKLKNIDTPFVFSRLYLPEVKNLDIDNLGSIIENMEKKTNLSPKTVGHTELYDRQVLHLKSIEENRSIYDDDSFDGDNDK